MMKTIQLNITGTTSSPMVKLIPVVTVPAQLNSVPSMAKDMLLMMMVRCCMDGLMKMVTVRPTITVGQKMGFIIWAIGMTVPWRLVGKKLLFMMRRMALKMTRITGLTSSQTVKRELMKTAGNIMVRSMPLMVVVLCFISGPLSVKKLMIQPKVLPAQLRRRLLPLMHGNIITALKMVPV